MARHLLRGLGPVPSQLPVGSDTLSWRIAREPVLLVGGGRALLMQVAHPLVAAGVAQHSNYRADPWSRLFSTLDTVFTMMFADAEASERAALRLRRRHEVVNGTADDGTPYNALDADLLLWVWATLVDTAVLVYDRCLSPLTADERERYLAEQRLFALACGIPADHGPRNWREFAGYVDSTTHDVLRPTRVGCEVADQIRRPALPSAMRAVVGVPLGLLTAGLLPPRLREQLGFGWSKRHARAFNAAFAAARAQRLVPASLRALPVTVVARREAPLKPPRWLRAT
jgi:uncharacterized protein (DUF2236 family)